MSLSPTTGISKLSLESMPPTTRSRREVDPSHEAGLDREPQGEGDDSMDEDNDSTIRSPTRLKYNIERLSPHTRKLVRSLWGETFEEPPEISLQWCDRMLDADGNIDFYAFQMHEVVPRSVRIGSPKSQYSEPQCQCGATKPCKHLLWLSDCIAQQALQGHGQQEPLTLNERGYPDELGEPFRCIADMRLDVLADGLHCDVGHPLARSGPSPQRLADAQSIIASIAEVDEHLFDSYRSDLTYSSFDSRSLVHYKDAEATLFSLLVASHRLSAWVRSRLRPSDPARTPFRQIESRARRIFADLDAFFASSTSAGKTAADAEGACDVQWAATNLSGCVRQIYTLIARAEAPLPAADRASAARALVRILRGVVDRQNDSQGDSLYGRLIGDRDEGFLTDSLELLVDQSQFIDEIEDIMVEVGVRGAAASWVAKMEAIVARMRTNRRSSARAASGGSRRVAPGKELRSQRVVSPALGPVEHGEPGSASASGFLTPETAAGSSSRGRGGGNGRGSRGSSGGAGSKRSGAGTGSERGSKRAR
ncbi:hypothetical protein CONLIGDRAFT_566542 [Coniochaeta ligniaria NRRL 30616]|uniref:SWIM-type domain-containing protein n=1 Tax=Coniochaeta ligniaria NRRL 30616 TaxID=1408157 RepID=A0A1J7J7Q8_9PEZI|nr:hypothetical protein CONLIGDRAFT_566542 [Coniochaeta ligniaria NRRL 30616]